MRLSTSPKALKAAYKAEQIAKQRKCKAVLRRHQKTWHPNNPMRHANSWSEVCAIAEGRS